MKISSTSYTSIAQDYKGAMQWMESIGVVLGAGRTKHYQKVIEYWKDHYKIASEEQAQKIFPEFVNSMCEISSFIGIYKKLKDEPIAELKGIREKLNKGVNGPIELATETAKSTTARNFIFEATTAARFHNPKKGISSLLNTVSDTGIHFEKNKIWVECKRITTIKKIEKNIRKASGQLERILREKIGSSNKGLVAIDISKILNKGDNIFVQENDALLISAVEKLMNDFIVQNAKKWENIYASRDRKIIGTVVYFSFMSVSEDRSLLVSVAEWAINPRLNIRTSEENLLNSIVEIVKITV
ncbi:MAG: hypothetical protein HFP78_02190 [Methylococcales symbiont of Hymedesmia sp. n. MRB-2018]|nr:MAG: hypothetical protein HFP78_02190 [Methylococcales symbiont of Hymedesmia sp. n. MRB-2018]